MLSRDHETGNPLAGLSGAQRARRRWVCHLATVPRDRGIGSEAYLNGTSQGEPVLSLPALSSSNGSKEHPRTPGRTSISVVAASDS
ncbi:MAG: hypothetical protein OEV25_07195 [Deltaproteobacteria bacterium]|nr:hypothetical protein [Deltaproteobacteria bacterium]